MYPRSLSSCMQSTSSSMQNFSDFSLFYTRLPHFQRIIFFKIVHLTVHLTATFRFCTYYFCPPNCPPKCPPNCYILLFPHYRSITVQTLFNTLFEHPFYTLCAPIFGIIIFYIDIIRHSSLYEVIRTSNCISIFTSHTPYIEGLEPFCDL